MLINPSFASDRLMALPEIPPETNAAPLGESVPSKGPALSWAVFPAVSSKFQCAMISARVVRAPAAQSVNAAAKQRARRGVARAALCARVLFLAIRFVVF